jgi:hypothetical protein
LSQFFALAYVLALICLCSQERLQTGYDIMTRTLPWIVKQSSNMEHDEYISMIKMVCAVPILPLMDDFIMTNICVA